MLSQNLNENIIKIIPFPIPQFLHQLTEGKNYITSDYLSEFEKDRLSLDANGQFLKLSHPEKQVVCL